ncbi:uncharacterized protein MELLADRAFT_69585 [Melampsora larici-populina 98AG31]|uniref:DUF7082 domain-containing protein n=1 Tax=Melampsora larici-populina (strain 98AG31 / pathotype 3-4-7) TaxID=747676 RepID=F4SB95_MELLP|nr:uncharacterized protein MELLADRAFT_69585 [Melampsora larici-populina 98AG31]EGF98056.1 hypothetical protein MELLADRAFT_69585 [Melampsora larici-populina 98AG31]
MISNTEPLLAVVQNHAASFTDTPELTADLSPFSTLSEPTSPSQRLSLQSLSLSTPRKNAPDKPIYCNSVQLIDWGPRSGIAGTNVKLELLHFTPLPKTFIEATISLKSDTLQKYVAADLISPNLSITQHAVTVTFTIPQIPLSSEAHHFFVSLCLEYQEHSDLSRQTIYVGVGEYVYLDKGPASPSETTLRPLPLRDVSSFADNQPSHLSTDPQIFDQEQSTNNESFRSQTYPREDSSYPREPASARSKPTPSTPAFGVPSLWGSDGSTLPNHTLMHSPWATASVPNSCVSQPFAPNGSKVSEYETFDQENRRMSFDINRMYYESASDREFEPNIVALTSVSRVGRCSRSKSHSDSRPMRMPDYEAPQLHSYARREENRLILRIEGALSDIMCGWTNEETRCGRRLVQFSRKLQGSVLTVYFQAVPSHKSEPDNRNGVVSCIYRDDPDGCFITSVDMISLIESLVGTNFPTAEKNRIRRNLQGFKPITVTKSKPDSEAFFKRIMSFQNPKPRNIEKDIKVFAWGSLESALAKVLGKYTCISDGPDDPRAIINFEFQSPSRDSLRYTAEPTSAYSLFPSLRESPMVKTDPTIGPSGRPTRSHSSGAINLSTAATSHTNWRPDNEGSLPDQNVIEKSLDFAYALPWQFAAQSDSPNSCSSFDTMTTIPDRIETGAPLASFVRGHEHISQPPSNPKSNFMIHDRVYSNSSSDARYLDLFEKRAYGLNDLPNPTFSRNIGSGEENNGMT